MCVGVEENSRNLMPPGKKRFESEEPSFSLFHMTSPLSASLLRLAETFLKSDFDFSLFYLKATSMLLVPI
jgi:hypothetical protein